MFPPSYPVRVSLVPLSRLADDEHGVCEVTYIDKRISRFNIKVANTLPSTAMIDTLWEEWSHMLRMHLLHVGDCQSHDAIYGAIFNEIKRTHEDSGDVSGEG